MTSNNGSSYARSPPLHASGNHSYVNLNQAQTGSRLPSFQDSSRGSVLSGTKKPVLSPRSTLPGSVDINLKVASPLRPNNDRPDNWYSPPSSIHSNSRPTSIVGPIHSKGNGKVNSNYSRPISMASSNFPVIQAKLQTIDEDSNMLSVDKVLELCTHQDEDIQMNAFGYLQHITFNNPDNKMQVRDYQGLPIIVDQITSENNYVSRAALGLLKNMAYSDVETITTEIEALGTINKLVDILQNTEDITQKELALDVIWNLSAKYNLKPIILTEVIPTLINSIIIPDSGMVREEFGNYVQGEDEVAWSTMLRNSLGIIRNVSYESSAARSTLRNVDGLVDCILYIIFKAGNRSEDEEEEPDNQLARIDTKVVENSVCILRNLTFAVQEIIDPNYLEKRRNNDKNAKSSSKENDSKMISPPEPSGVPKGYELLWNSKYIVTALFPIMKNGANAVTLEAAAGVVQNLTAGDWKPSKEMQIQFRLQLALPTLIELVDFGTNEVIRTAATALRNLVQENFCCMLIGKNGLKNLTEKIPMSSRSKEIEPTAVAALLSTIYVIISDEVEFMKDFIANKGVNRCLHVRDLEEFVIPDDPFPDKVKIFSQCILELLWKTPVTQEILKKNNIKQSDIFYNHNNKSGNSARVKMHDDIVSNNARKHESIVSDEWDRGAQYPKDERYCRDSLSEIVSNNGLRDRNSAAYTTSSIPGYGVVRVPASNVKASKRNTVLETIQSDSRITSPAFSSKKKESPLPSYHTRGTTPIAQSPIYSPRAMSPRTMSPTAVSPRPMPQIGSLQINGKLNVDARKKSTVSAHSNGPRRSHDITDGNLPLNQRHSDKSNFSKDSDYKYARPMKQGQSPVNGNLHHNYRDSGV